MRGMVYGAQILEFPAWDTQVGSWGSPGIRTQSMSGGTGCGLAIFLDHTTIEYQNQGWAFLEGHGG